MNSRTPVTLIHSPVEHALKETQDEAVKAQVAVAGAEIGRYLLLYSQMNLMDLPETNKVMYKRSSNFIEILSELLNIFHRSYFPKERHIDSMYLFPFGKFPF